MEWLEEADVVKGGGHNGLVGQADSRYGSAIIYQRQNFTAKDGFVFV